MKVLVTGGSGFIGSYVCKELWARGHSVQIFDIKSSGNIINGAMVHHTISQQAEGVIQKVEGVIHLAGILGTQELVNDCHKAVEVNVLGGLNVLDALADHNVPAAFIGVGNYWMNNPYSITKSTVDRFALMYNKERGTRVNIVRTVNAYGPGQEPAEPYGKSKVRKVLPSFICRALANDQIEVYGDGDQFSDMVFVEDVAKGLCNALERARDGEVFRGIVDLGPVHHTSVRDLANRVKSLTGSKSEIVHLPMRPGEVPQNVVADTRSMRLLDMSPDDLKPLGEGLEETIAYYRA